MGFLDWTKPCRGRSSRNVYGRYTSPCYLRILCVLREQQASSSDAPVAPVTARDRFALKVEAVDGPVSCSEPGTQLHLHGAVQGRARRPRADALLLAHETVHRASRCTCSIADDRKSEKACAHVIHRLCVRMS